MVDKTEFYQAYTYDYPKIIFQRPKDAKIMFAFIWILIKAVILVLGVGIPLMLYSLFSFHSSILIQLPFSPMQISTVTSLLI